MARWCGFMALANDMAEVIVIDVGYPESFTCRLPYSLTNKEWYCFCLYCLKYSAFLGVIIKKLSPLMEIFFCYKVISLYGGRFP
jgi:hypothetical protein